MISYSETQIQSALALLNQLGVKGIENCQRVCMIEQILQHPEEGEGEKDGNCNKEE